MAHDEWWQELDSPGKWNRSISEQRVLCRDNTDPVGDSGTIVRTPMGYTWMSDKRTTTNLNVGPSRAQCRNGVVAGAVLRRPMEAYLYQISSGNFEARGCLLPRPDPLHRGETANTARRWVLPLTSQSTG